jgi:tetratricopeptide (TPR) repeat protein
MNIMKTAMHTVLVLVCFSAAAQTDQDWNKAIKMPPEELAKMERAGAALSRGRALMKENNVEEAISAFREAIAVHNTMRGFYSSGNYELAKALVLAGRPEEALAAYKNAINYREDWKDLHVNGPPAVRLAMDYAILLAKRGKDDEAKAMYYYGLRAGYNSGPDVQGYIEPFPFMVVFDEDPSMTVWGYTPERLIAAATMARLATDGDRLTGDGALETTKKVKLVEASSPDWAFPSVYRFRNMTYREGREFLDLAFGLAANDDERAWINKYYEALASSQGASDMAQRLRDTERELAAIGHARRRASPVLQQAKLDLEQNWQKVAGSSSGSGAGPGGAGCSCTARVGLRAWIGG